MSCTIITIITYSDIEYFVQMVSQIPINLFSRGVDLLLGGNVYHNESISILGDICFNCRECGKRNIDIN